MRSPSPIATSKSTRHVAESRVADGRRHRTCASNPAHSLNKTSLKRIKLNVKPSAAISKRARRMDVAARLDSGLVDDEASTELASSPCRSDDRLSDVSRGDAHALCAPKAHAEEAGGDAVVDGEFGGRVASSPDIWHLLCSLVDVDDDDDPLLGPKCDAALRFDRAHDVDVVSWDRMDSLMQRHEYGQWACQPRSRPPLAS